jgi:hypothetical protein
MEWLGTQGYGVWIPIGHSPDCDLIAEVGERLLRVQVKTTTRFRHGRWEVMLCTRGGNQSWNGTVRLFSSARADRLFVLVGDGRRWFIPADVVSGGTGLLLGGPKSRALRGSAWTTASVERWCLIAILDSLGGVPERSKGCGCKPHGSAFAGSNPAPAMSPCARGLEPVPEGHCQHSAPRFARHPPRRGATQVRGDPPWSKHTRPGTATRDPGPGKPTRGPPF